MRSDRVATIDGARGAAMLVVFLAHFADAYYGAHPRHQFIIGLTRVASPAFILLSGVMLGLLHRRHRDDFGPTRDRFIDRGLFLLLVGHPLLVGGVFFKSPRWIDTLEVMFMTDTIGVCLIFGSLLVTHWRARARLLAGAGLLLLTWVLVLLWAPRPHSDAWWAKDVLTADWRGDGLSYKFPLLPWFGLYLVGSSAGSLVAGRLADADRRRRLRLVVMLLGAVSIAAGLGVRGGLRLLAAALSSPPTSATSATLDHAAGLRQIASLTEKLPPGPAYVSFYGGLALLMFWLVLAGDETSAGRAWNRWAALFGRCSLVCFIAQFYIYYTGVYLLPKPPEWLAPLYLLLTVAILRLFAGLWDRRGLNRLITVGYRRIATPLRGNAVDASFRRDRLPPR